MVELALMEKQLTVKVYVSDYKKKWAFKLLQQKPRASWLGTTLLIDWLH